MTTDTAPKSRSETDRHHITDTFCKKAKVKPGQRVTVYSDSETRGFCLVVTAAGAKTFAVRYTLKDGDEAGKQVRVTLGPYLEANGKAVATYRREAAKAIGDAARGIDRASKRAEVRKGATIAELCARYMKEHAPKKRSEAMDRNRIDRYILPAWKHRKAASITRGDVRTLLAPIEFGDKAAGLPPRPYEAIGVLALIKKLFSFAIDAEVVTQHPCARMKIDAPELESRELSAAHDLRAFWNLTSGDYAAHMPAPFAAALRFQLLTGSRPGEVFGMTWDELDLEANEWTLPAERSKNKREHLVPLTPILRAIIDAQAAAQAAQQAEAEATGKKVRTSRFVFPALRGGRVTDKMRGLILDRALQAYKKAGHKLERFTPHDLRGTAETVMAAAEVPKEYRDRLLNHVDNSVGGKHYNKHDYKSQKRDALLTLEQWIEARRAPTPSAGNVVTSIRRKA
ncbi:tyrosine-type recombinase/integrase [Rhodanobacter umsongensis]